MSDLLNENENHQFQLFEFTEEVIESFRENKEIPVHFYNKDGQILIYKKEDATDKEIERILRFVDQGIYYDINDKDKLGIKDEEREVPDGLSDVKLLGEQAAEELSREATELFGQLKKTSLTSIQAKKSSEKLAGVFNDFEDQPDAMTGLVNIIELMKDPNADDQSYDVELAVKRTVVAMAMKTRGMQAQSYRDRVKMQEMVTILMMSAMLCDVGQAKMQMPEDREITAEQFNYIKNHPLMSYMMIAHEPSIDTRVKFNVLCHHRPIRDGSVHNNNYPPLKALLNKLTALEEQYKQDPRRRPIAENIREQLVMLRTDVPYHEDTNIVALASEFASLTSKVPWRDAYPPERAVRMIINNSYFTYADRIVREFLDYVAISLCDNNKILKEGDFIIVAARTRNGNTFFEVCQITDSNRYQSRPGIDRIGTITPIIEKSPKLRFAGFDLDTLKPDPRHAHYELSKDDTRHIIYSVDPDYDQQLFKKFTELVRGRKGYNAANDAARKKASSA